jgi:hypothetical protein
VGSGREWTVDRLTNSYSSSDLAINYDEISEPQFYRTELSDLATYASVKYYRSPENGVEQKEATDEDTNFQTYYNITKDQSTIDFEADHVRVAAAAAILAENTLVNNRKALHNMVEGTLDKSYLALDIADIIEFTNMPYNVGGEDITSNTTRNGQTVYKYWIVTGISRSGDGVTFKAMQLHAL